MSTSEFALLKRGNFKPRTEPPHGIVIHTAGTYNKLSKKGDTAAERVASWGASRGCRVSWHATCDADSIVWCLPEDKIAYHAKGYNTNTLGLEIACDPEDLVVNADWREAILLNAAFVTAYWCHTFKIKPVDTRVMVHSHARERRRFDEGIFGHMDTNTFRRQHGWSAKRDPGLEFPWEYFMFLVDTLVRAFTANPALDRHANPRAVYDLASDVRSDDSAREDHLERLIALEDVVGGSTARVRDLVNGAPLSERMGNLESAHHRTWSDLQALMEERLPSSPKGDTA